MIAVEQLTKVFGRTVAVRDVSFHAGAGEAVGLLGPNGSGKTTIMRTLAGYFPPTSGRIAVDGIDVGRAALRARQRIGYLPESAVCYPDMRVRQFLEFCADVRRLRGAARRARLAAVLDGCGLADVQHRLIGHLSKGYRQRVGIAQAIVHEPAVLILDEPTVGLDPRQVVEIRQLVRALRGRTTVLLSTHILSEVASVCDRVVIIDRGRVLAENSAAALAREQQRGERTLLRVDGPAAPVAAALRAVPGVERVDVEQADAGPAQLTVTTGGDVPAPALLAATVVGHGWGLIEIRPLSMSLEELYVRLVAPPAEPPAA
jgi:gliding motility-associated transport system ATP-binding protein